MTPVLDIRTLVLIYVGIRLGQAVVLLYLWRVQRNYPPAKDWAIGALMSAIGLLLFASRNVAPVLVSEILSNALLLPGWMIFDFGIAKAADRIPPVKIGLSLCALALVALVWTEAVSPNYAAAVWIQNLVFITFDLYAAYACFRVSEARRNFTFKLIGALLVLLVMVCAWRVAGSTFAATLASSPTLPRLFWIATSLVTFPMITLLLTLHTSQRLQDEINEQARHDTLTGAYNRRALAEFADREWVRAVRHGYPFSVLTVDIDHFKIFNDQHGHPIGDATLVQVSASSQAALRADDIWCRYGGEEFVALLPNTSIEQAMVVAERLRSSVEKATITTPNGLLNVSVSIGVAERSSSQSSWADALAASDAALYDAKRAGRNRIAASGSTTTIASTVA